MQDGSQAVEPFTRRYGGGDLLPLQKKLFLITDGDPPVISDILVAIFLFVANSIYRDQEVAPTVTCSVDYLPNDKAGSLFGKILYSSL